METLAFGQPILRRDMKIRIVENLAEYFGDSNTRNIILREYDPDNGRVVWNNKSLAALPCNSQEVSWVRRYVNKDLFRAVQLAKNILFSSEGFSRGSQITLHKMIVDCWIKVKSNFLFLKFEFS